MSYCQGLCAALWETIIFTGMSNTRFFFFICSLFIVDSDFDTTAKVLKIHLASDSGNTNIVALHTWSCLWNCMTFFSAMIDCSFTSDTNVTPPQDHQVIISSEFTMLLCELKKRN